MFINEANDVSRSNLPTHQKSKFLFKHLSQALLILIKDEVSFFNDDKEGLSQIKMFKWIANKMAEI